ncbi:Golgi SNAP receptor complex member 1-2 isoform X2 [Selaginella moellendorffii]|uniref:Golgi SNAP receptor complex member 1-2 isoform X2 n=1 Tax=Selaginella moellendorffii TaxID=88036 RepID=UPI000D1C476B|nr:Golgi SNAP receptor complex member 1-2 isoform X2 [Selaginella moellendorffii]XP_024533936.1 Golgi SNAP receptor complex member 1-2 isoform X2 [Selaginella moellendorffii]|eukprot:XP_024523006.1 Golgi SNAP receptor complex member 1-2 isoform X2 [Selaginella moellendorffii]
MGGAEARSSQDRRRPRCQALVLRQAGRNAGARSLVGYVDSPSTTDGHGAGAGDVAYNSMEMEIESLLEKLLDLNDAMSRCVASATSTASISQKLARHRDILHELTQEFRRTRGNINSMREHADLLSSVRSEISEFKASGNVSPGPSLLRERAAIHGSISQIDDVIGQAQATKAALSFQRSTFLEIQGKMKQLSDRFPIVRSLLGAIKRKRSRDTLILSAVIAFCLLFLLIYWMAK